MVVYVYLAGHVHKWLHAKESGDSATHTTLLFENVIGVSTGEFKVGALPSIVYPG